MKAFVELWCAHAGIVRVGPQAEHFGDPYLYALAFSVRDGWATIEGLCFRGPPSAAKAGIAALESAGLKVRWERHRAGTIREVRLGCAE